LHRSLTEINSKNISLIQRLNGEVTPEIVPEDSYSDEINKPLESQYKKHFSKKQPNHSQSNF